MAHVLEQPKGGRWPWRVLLPIDLAGVHELRELALEAGYSRTVVAGFVDWIETELEEPGAGGRAPTTEARYRRMLVELTPHAHAAA